MSKFNLFLKTILFTLIMIQISFVNIDAGHVEAVEPFQQALPGYEYSFPRDFFSHDEFKIEWWYYTGNLQDFAGRRFGYQLTFFRVALDGTNKILNPSRWKIDHIYFAHMTVTDIQNEDFYFFERINRKGLNNAGSRSDRFLVWNEDWILTEQESSHRLKAFDSETGIDLNLTPLKELVIHGQSGVSQKGAGKGNASHYFSYTRMETKGKIKVLGKEYRVTGLSWMDHEFSSSQLGKNQIGWDWFSLKLNQGLDIMLYQIRLNDGTIEPFSSGSLVRSDGSTRHLNLKDYKIQALETWVSPHTKIAYPSRWEIHLPDEDIHLAIKPDVTDQELHHLRSISGAYWEGSVTIEGRIQGKRVEGQGYVELVGYGKPLDTSAPLQ